MTVLLDANVLIALLVDDHVHHGPAEDWFVRLDGKFATCPSTQGSLMRLLIREGRSAATAREVLNGTLADARHEFWADDVSYADVPTVGITGHRQVTDSYLAHLARRHNSRLATFDQGLAKLHSDVAQLVAASAGLCGSSGPDLAIRLLEHCPSELLAGYRRHFA